MNEHHQKLERQLKERTKELSAFYMLFDLTGQDNSLEEVCRKTANYLPKCWQYSNICCSQILLKEHQFQSDNFAPSSWQQACPIRTNGRDCGHILIGYLEQRPPADEGPFLKEERMLLDAMAQALGQITERQENETALRESEARFRELVEFTSDWIWEVDSNGVYTYSSPRVEALLGYRPDEVIGKTPFDLMPPEEAERIGKAFAQIAQQVQPFQRLENINRHRDGHLVVLETSGIPILDDAGTLIGYRGIDRDITERKRDEVRLRQSASVFENANEGIMITQKDGTIVDVNEAFSRITGYPREEVLGQNPRLLKSGRHDRDYYQKMWKSLGQHGHWIDEIWNRRKDGELYATMQNISAVKDGKGNIQHYVSLFSDITAIKEYQQRLEHIAHFDPLTNLPNRTLLTDRMRQAMAQSKRHSTVMGVAFLDLDGFKEVNDNYGHDTGDQLLRALSERMKEALREGDTLARIGGDEFVALLLDLPTQPDDHNILNRLLEAAAEPVWLKDTMLQISASVGVTQFPQNEPIEADQLIRQADQAMYIAKQGGKNRYHRFDIFTDPESISPQGVLARLRQALIGKQFILYYQPKVDMRSGQVIGAEALIRWRHPERGLLPPASFMPALGDDPLAVEVGDWVLEQATNQITAWREAGYHIPVSVNIDAIQLSQPDFFDKLNACLRRHPSLQPGDLELEILESSALEDVARVAQLIAACEEIGISFSLDDFGTGYSTLSYLKQLPARVLKIDRSFVRDMLEDVEDLAVLDGIIGLADAFRRETIAEGVETAAHGTMLLSLGCHLAQGYGIAHPMPPDVLPAWIKSWRPDPTWANKTRVSGDDLPVLFAMVEHRAWIEQLRVCLRDDKFEPPPFDPKRCHVGRWLNEDGRGRYNGHRALEQIESVHLRVHQTAQQLVELRNQGNSEQVLHLFAEVESLRDQLLESMEQLISRD